MQFCTKCKSMMFPKNGNFECRKCGNIIPIKGNKKNFVSKAKIDDREVVVLEGEQTSGLPTTNARCPECGNNTAFWWLRQLRYKAIDCSNFFPDSSNARNVDLPGENTTEV